MQLVLKQGDRFVKEAHFAQGPVYIGRSLDSHLCIDHDALDAEHVVLCGADQTEWFAEHIGSKTPALLNRKPFKKQRLRDGDVLEIGEYHIEIQLTGKAALAALAAMSPEEIARRIAARPPKNIIRLFDQPDSPDIRIPPRRYKDYVAVVTAICRAPNEQELVKVLLAVTKQQFGMLHTFIAVRPEPTGPFTCQVGKRRTGQSLQLKEMVFQHFIWEAVDKRQYILIPILPEQQVYERIRSAVISPILAPGGCYGVVYADNAVDDPHYSLQDLDYLMLLSVQAGARLRQLAG